MATNKNALTDITVSTAIWALNQAHAAVKSSYAQSINLTSTINHKHGCFASVRPTVIPNIRYFGIGIKGRVNLDDNSGVWVNRPKASNLDIYQPVPFRCIREAEDASFAERANYRMRTIETFNGIRYACYWLKALNFETDKPSLSIVDAAGASTPFDLDPATNLYPVPSLPNSTDVINSLENTIVAAQTATYTVLGREIWEMVNAMFSGDPTKAFVSEIGFYTGEDKLIDPAQDGGSLAYTEAMYVQLAGHRCWTGQSLTNTTAQLSESVTFGNGSRVVA